MSKKHNQKLITPEIVRQAVIGSFVKLNPRYMMKNPVMFVVEVGFFITLILSIFPSLFGDQAASICVLIISLFQSFSSSRFCLQTLQSLWRKAVVRRRQLA